MADENIAGGSAVFRRHGEQIGACLRSDPEGLRRSHEMFEGIDDIHAYQFVAVTLEHPLECEPAPFYREPVIVFEQVARGAAERARIGAARLGKLKRKTEEAGVFRCGKPPAGIAAQGGQIQEDLLRVVAGILPGDRTERREAR